MRWAELKIDAGANATDAVGFALEQAGCQGFAVRDRGQPPSIAGYLPVDDRLEARLDQLKDALTGLPAFGIEDAGTDITLRYVEEADWANAWKAFYKPMRVGRRFVVTPPWESPELAADDIPLVIDPGMAFGTGSHPTTQLCLAALEDAVHPGHHVADIGTGSGILAIAAAKLGAASILATDIDPLAVKIAGENAVANGVPITVQETFPDGAFDVVVANILADVIIGLAEPLAALVKPGGQLIASGIIDTRADDVRSALQAVGLSCLDTRESGEWVALLCRREQAVTRFFVRPDQIANGTATLDAADAHHLRVVLKAQPGDKLAILDGRGQEYPGVLEVIGKTKAMVRLSLPFSPGTEPRVKITVAQALPKVADKMEQVWQHGTEIGAAAFWAFASERSLTQLTGERQEKRLARWQAIVKTAAEQAYRSLLPSVQAKGDFADVLTSAKAFDLALFAHPAASEPPLRDVLKSAQTPQTLLIIVGPESGFTDSEARQATNSGAVSVSLGPRILRTETAALVLLSQILYALE